MHLKFNQLLALTTLGCCSVGIAQTTLVSWDTSSIESAQITFSPTSSSPEITGLDISRGDGLGSTNLDGTFASNGFSGSDADDFVQFGLTVDSGFAADLTQLSIDTSTSNTGPGTLGLYSSLDSFSTSLFTFSQSGTSTLNWNVDLSTLTSVTGTLTFRIFEIGDTQADGDGATGTTGAFRIADLVINGTVSPIPEPASFALLAGLGMIGLAAGRRPRRASPA